MTAVALRVIVRASSHATSSSKSYRHRLYQPMINAAEKSKCRRVSVFAEGLRGSLARTIELWCVSSSVSKHHLLLLSNVIDSFYWARVCFLPKRGRFSLP
jgi:hypothetical protein